MIIENEEQLLDQAYRKQVIDYIESGENRARKDEMFKRYQCYKDKTDLYVLSYLLQQFDADTVNEMRYALANLGFSRKVIDKLARVYKYGVQRDLYVNGEEQEDNIIMAASQLLNVDQTMKKTNRFFKLFKNTMLYIRPVENKIKLTPLAPYLYDALVREENKEKAVAVVLSDYTKPSMNLPGVRNLAALPGTDGRNGRVVEMQRFGDVAQEDKKQYVFWSDSFHFVCDSKGNIIPSEASGENPIGELPFVNYADDQDGEFWAEGGSDLTSGAILINAMITNINHIGITQGYGQLVLTGKDLPKQVKVGPNKAIRLTHEGEDPVPTFKFESANPPLDQLRALVEMYVALLLTTNNLSTSGVSSQLNGTGSFPSGIAMLIDKAESMEDVEDQRQVFQDNEPKMWNIIAKWHESLKAADVLEPELKALSFPAEFSVKTEFSDPKPIETEKERLETLKIKRELGLVSLLDMIKAENPQLDDEQVEAKAAEILKERMENALGGQQVEQSQDPTQPSDETQELSDNHSFGFGRERV